MKKLAFMFVAVAAISVSSCTGQTQATTEVADSDSVAIAEEPVACDSVCCDSTAADSAVVAE